MTKLTKHEKADKVKWAFTVIAFVLAFVLLLGIALQVFSPVGNRPTDWFEEIGKVEENPDEVQDETAAASDVSKSETASLDGNEVEENPVGVQVDPPDIQDVTQSGPSFAQYKIDLPII